MPAAGIEGIDLVAEVQLLRDQARGTTFHAVLQHETHHDIVTDKAICELYTNHNVNVFFLDNMVDLVSSITKLVRLRDSQSPDTIGSIVAVLYEIGTLAKQIRGTTKHGEKIFAITEMLRTAINVETQAQKEWLAHREVFLAGLGEVVSQVVHAKPLLSLDAVASTILKLQLSHHKLNQLAALAESPMIAQQELQVMEVLLRCCPGDGTFVSINECAKAGVSQKKMNILYATKFTDAMGAWQQLESMMSNEEERGRIDSCLHMVSDVADIDSFMKWVPSILNEASLHFGIDVKFDIVIGDKRESANFEQTYREDDRM